jgi:porin
MHFAQKHYSRCPCETYFFAAALLLFIPASSAEDVGFGGPDAVSNQLEQDREGWGDFKEDLAGQGLRFTVDYSAIGMEASDATAGADDDSAGGMVRFYGQWDALGKGTENTGALIWKVEHRHAYTDTAPKQFLFGAGALGLAVPPFSDEGGRLTNLYWKQRFNDGRSTVVAGFLDATDYVDVYMLASPWTGFVNFAFSTGTTTIALPGDATLGAAGASMLGDNFFVIGGITDMNSDPTDPLEGFDSFFNGNKYFKSIELGWTASHSQIYTDNVHITAWHADESEVQGTADGWGINLSASRLFGQWLPFVRVGYSEDAGTLFEKSISAGTGYLGLGGKNNNLGIGLNWADVENGDDQYTTEIYYKISVLSALEITPDIQWIRNPALQPGRDDLFIYGLRARLAL